MRILYSEQPMGNLMRDKDINLPYCLYREEDGVVLGYVRHETTAREISQSSGVVYDNELLSEKR